MYAHNYTKRLSLTHVQVFLPSTRNSDEAHVHLLQATSPVAFLYTPEFKGKVQALRVQYPKMNIFEIPSLDSMLAGDAQHYPYTKSFEEEEDQVSVVMHTSGTTGTALEEHMIC